MDASISEMEMLGSLDEAIEGHVGNLVKILARQYDLEELQAEVSKLNNLLYTFALRNELVQKLIDSATPEDKRRRIAKTLETLQIKVSNDRTEVRRQFDRSNELIKRAVGLITRAQRLIDKESYRHSGYDTKSCGSCKGLRKIEGKACSACKGEGIVLVRQPAQMCPRCKGQGTESSSIKYSIRACSICSGTGWSSAVQKVNLNQ